MVAGGRVLLLVGVLVLLVHNHEAEVAERKKDGGADTEDNVIVCFRQLLLPDFYPFRIGEFGVVDAQTGTENTLQALCDLCSESYFGQEIEHLLSLPDGFFYQMNIDFCLAACRDAVQQADVLALEILQDGVIGALLVFVQRIDGDDFFEKRFIYAAYFLLINFEYTTVYKTVEYGRGGGGALQQFGFGDFFYISSAEVAGEFQIFHQQVQLLGGTALQLVEEDVQAVFVAGGGGEAYTGFGLRLVGAAQFFLYEDGLFVEQ